MHGFTMALAQEVARKGVTVTPVSPGYMNTRMVEMVPQEILTRHRRRDSGRTPRRNPRDRGSRRFLCSDEAGFITGANYSINGGHHMH